MKPDITLKPGLVAAICSGNVAPTWPGQARP
jgi:hypothetical protein